VVGGVDLRTGRAERDTARYDDMESGRLASHDRPRCPRARSRASRPAGDRVDRARQLRPRQRAASFRPAAGGRRSGWLAARCAGAPSVSVGESDGLSAARLSDVPVSRYLLAVS